MYSTRSENPSETRRTAFDEITTELDREGSRVWFVRLPDAPAVTNHFLQQGHPDPESGAFSTYTCLLPVDDKTNPDFPTQGWRLYLHWELPLEEGWASTANEKKKSTLSKIEYEKKKAARAEQQKALAGV